MPPHKIIRGCTFNFQRKAVFLSENKIPERCKEYIVMCKENE